MNSRTILATLVGAIVSFLLGWLLYGLLLMDYMEGNVHTYEGLRKPESEAMIGWVLGSIFHAILLCYILSAAGVKNFRKGATIGAIVSLLFGAWMGSYYQFTMNWYTTNTALIVELLVGVVMGIIVGGAIGWMLGRGTKPAA